MSKFSLAVNDVAYLRPLFDSAEWEQIRYDGADLIVPDGPIATKASGILADQAQVDLGRLNKKKAALRRDVKRIAAEKKETSIPDAEELRATAKALRLLQRALRDTHEELWGTDHALWTVSQKAVDQTRKDAKTEIDILKGPEDIRQAEKSKLAEIDLLDEAGADLYDVDVGWP